MARIAKDIQDAVAQLVRDQGEPIRTKVGEITVEVRVVHAADERERSAWDVFQEIGPWVGEDADSIAGLLATERRTRLPRGVEGL